MEGRGSGRPQVRRERPDLLGQHRSQEPERARRSRTPAAREARRRHSGEGEADRGGCWGDQAPAWSAAHVSRWPEVPLREVLSEYREYIDSPGARSYAKLSVKLYGKGVVLDAPADGAALKMKKHQLARAGQVILSEIWGKKGAIGLVPPEGDGALCTSHFFLFDLNHDRVLPGWLAAIFRANYLEEQLAGGAFGTTGYAAVRPKTLLSARIPLPPLPEQQRVVARIEGLATEFHGACFIRQQSMKLADVLMDATSNEVMSRLVDSCPLERLDKLTVLIADVNHEMPIAVEAGLPFVSPRDFVPKGIAYAGAKRISTLDFDRLSKI